MNESFVLFLFFLTSKIACYSGSVVGRMVSEPSNYFFRSSAPPHAHCATDQLLGVFALPFELKAHAGLFNRVSYNFTNDNYGNGTNALTRGPLWTSWDFFDASNIYEVQSGAKANI